jgi:hypothetical protein
MWFSSKLYKIKSLYHMLVTKLQSVWPQDHVICRFGKKLDDSLSFFSVLYSLHNDCVRSIPGQVKSKTRNMVFVTLSLSTHHYGERTKTGWLEV